ncbi:hypothetical protein CHLRE_02g109126v5 [Chlamydomonas reinhardtii]|uniref:Uncharacterized protein n=1 Tax=Chlamydomonas reinhardtii TaxID=3055 RepID=A0A2K3E2U7_CHLRE|nr:uncharacterized protein CHLRE_02g109126v5 [Chlamydomonas reinhardtii]PNW87102.1 hypothetical protein CHLRE_02g109126v5 [Chlamydomonas reinhardtii]
MAQYTMYGGMSHLWRALLGTIVLGRLGYKYSGGAGAGGQGEAAVQPPVRELGVVDLLALAGAAACAARSCSRARGADFNVLVVCNDCHMTWDRDENASLNMRLLLILQLLGHDRPAVFCRQEDGAAC